MSFRDWPILRRLSPNFLATVRIAFVFGGKGNEALMITCDDRVHGVGKNSSCCLGITNSNDKLPSVNSVLSYKNVEGFTCGGNAITRIYVIARLRNGELYQWGALPVSYYDTLLTPQRIEFNVKVNVKSVACGSSHSMILSDDGQVFTWGENDQGQLGRVEFEQIISSSRKSRTLIPDQVGGVIEGKVVTEISCGGEFSVVIVEGGNVVTWGRNRERQLGINSADNYSKIPVVVSALNSVVIQKIACGPSHILALSENGELYAWGSNTCSQLGFPATEKSYYAEPVKCAKNLRFVDICASYACDLSVAQCKRGEIYMWGKMSSGEIIAEPTDSQCESIHQVFAFYASPNMMPKPMRHILKAKRQMTTVMKTLENEFGNPDNSDLTILADNREIYVHKAMLRMRSTYFRSLLSDQWLKDNERVVTISKKSFPAVEAYLKYLYTDKLEVNLDLAVELLQLADEYGDKNFKFLCEQSVKRDLTADRVAELFACIKKLETFQDLNEFCLNYALKHAVKVIDSEGYKQWDLDTLRDFTTEYVKLKK